VGNAPHMEEMAFILEMEKMHPAPYPGSEVH